MDIVLGLGDALDNLGVGMDKVGEDASDNLDSLLN